MTVKELKALIKETLLEAVPFDKATDIEHELRKKYDELEGYTFGVEFEFEPVSESEPLSRDDIASKLGEKFNSRDDGGFTDGYYEWLENQRNSEAAAWVRRHGTLDTVDRFNSEYGPMSTDTFDEYIAAPVESDYANEEEYNQAYEKYDDIRNEVDSDYVRWQRRHMDEHVDEFISSLIRSSTWTDYISEDEYKIVDAEQGIDDAYDFLESLGEDVRKDDKPDKNTWAVGEDGPNVEIRSRHMSQTGHDFDIISKVGNWVSDQPTHGKTGMHIHIGVPRDFDMFDVLAMSTLVDEKAIQSEVSVDRDFSSYAKFRRSLTNGIFNKIRDYMLKQPDARETVPKSFILTNQQVKELMAYFDRNHGTNIQAFSEHKTIEFRYLGSDVAHRVLKWISYFLLLPRIAKSKNRINLDSIYGERLVATRMPGKIMFTMFKTNEPRTRVPMPKEPADDIKQKAFELPSKLDVAKQSAVKKQSGTQ